MARAMPTALAFLALAFLACVTLADGAQMARGLKYDYPNPKAPQLRVSPCGTGEQAMMMAELQARDGKDGNRRLLFKALRALLHDGHKHDIDTTITNKRGLLHGGKDDGDGDKGPMVKCSPEAPDNFARVTVTKELAAPKQAQAAGRK